MKKILIAILAAVALTACQKEPSFEDPNGGSGGTGGNPSQTGLLVRSVQVTSTDSNVTAYSYDAAKRLVLMEFSSQINFSNKIIRNSAGVINKVVIKSDEFSALGLDSVVTNVNYSTSLSRYTYTRFDVDFSGFTLSDSTLFNYDAAGNISSKVSYTKTIIGGYTLSSKVDYTYASGNILSEKNFDYNGSSFELFSTSTYTHDTKVNPLILGKEAIVIGNDGLFGPNNPILLTYDEVNNPACSYTLTSKLIYNAANKPSGGTITENPSGSTSTVRFYYN